MNNLEKINFFERSIALFLSFYLLYISYKIMKNENYSKKYKKIVGGTELIQAMSFFSISLAPHIMSNFFILGFFLLSVSGLFMPESVIMRFQEETDFAKNNGAKRWLLKHPLALRIGGWVIFIIGGGYSLILWYFSYGPDFFNRALILVAIIIVLYIHYHRLSSYNCRNKKQRKLEIEDSVRRLHDIEILKQCFTDDKRIIEHNYLILSKAGVSDISIISKKGNRYYFVLKDSTQGFFTKDKEIVKNVVINNMLFVKDEVLLMCPEEIDTEYSGGN